MTDLISREDAIDAIVNTGSKVAYRDASESTLFGSAFRQNEIIDIIKALPSAEAETSLKAIKRQIDEHWYLDQPSAEAVQGCDGCVYNTRTPQEQCLRCKRYWRDSYERKGGDSE